jgi:hypothetical protein
MAKNFRKMDDRPLKRGNRPLYRRREDVQKDAFEHPAGYQRLIEWLIFGKDFKNWVKSSTQR